MTLLRQIFRKMIVTMENRVGKIIYGILQIALLVLAVYTLKLESGDMGDDWVTIGLFLLMALLSFPISIVAAPLSIYLSVASVAVIYFLVGRFIDVSGLSSLAESAVIFLAWLGIFYCGYLQWFWFPRWSDKRLGKTRKLHSRF
jgi:hypothetical protein